MAIFSLKPDGSLAWSQTVLKDQTTTDDNGIFSSFGVLQHRLGNAYLFSDMSSKQFRLLAAYISANGQLTVKELQSNDEVDAYNLMPRSAVQISTSEIVMPCVSKNYLCFLKISY
jgi:5-enolpyruvylshikimate-3-phosphate synthase